MMVRALLVDDEVLERAALAKILKRMGLPLEVVGEARNGLEALELAGRCQPDLVFMDIKMPGPSGLETTKRLKEVCPDVKVIIITAYGEFDYAQEALKLGASDYILKPYLPGDLAPVVERVVAEITGTRIKRQEEEKLRHQLIEAMPYIQMSLGYDLLSGHCPDEDQIRARAEFLGVRGLPSVAMVADIDGFGEATWQRPEVEKQLLKNRVYQAIKSATSAAESVSALMLPFSGDEMVILCAFPEGEGGEEARNRVMQLAETARQAVEEHTEVTVTIGIGRSYGPTQLHRSYQEASEAQQLGSFFLGPNRVVHWDQLAALRLGDQNYPLETERLIVESVRAGNRETALGAARELITVLLGPANNGSCEVAKVQLIELLTVLSRNVAAPQVYSRDLGREKFRYLKKLLRCRTVGELNRWVEEVIDSYVHHALEGQSRVNSAAVAKAVDYIQKNYRQEVSLTDVARVIYLNPQYFSRVFRREMGMTFVDYLTKVRMEKAKELLMGTDLPVSAIAREVGYPDANYFSRLFKKKEHVSPTEYRQSRGKPPLP
jgi:two-component system response regulator YesN